MIIRDCIVKAAGYLGLADLAEAYKTGDQQTEGLFDIAKDVVAEICANYYPIKVVERMVAANDGSIKYQSFSKPVIDVFKVIKNETSFPFLVKYDRIETCFSGSCSVEYSFMPDMTSLNTVLPFSNRIDARVVAYGIAAEYALINRPEDAAMFDKRFKDALKKAVIVKSEKRVKQRSWL